MTTKISIAELASHADAASWEAWLTKEHASSDGVWLKLEKKKPGALTYQQALDVALCFGWIDGQKKSLDASSWTQRFTPRRARSIWSQRNCARAEELVGEGKMRPAGQAEIDRAKADGRWHVAYASPKNATVPDDLATALAANKKAAAFFADLDATNRYSFLHRIMTVKKAETRARKITEFVAMLARGDVFHHERLKKPAPKSAPTKSAPKKSAPKKSAPKKSAPKKSAPKKRAPKKSAPKKRAPKKSARG